MPENCLLLRRSTICHCLYSCKMETSRKTKSVIYVLKFQENISSFSTFHKYRIFLYKLTFIFFLFVVEAPEVVPMTTIIIVASVCGVIVVILLLILVILCCRRRQKNGKYISLMDMHVYQSTHILKGFYLIVFF